MRANCETSGMPRQTYFAKPGEIAKNWHHVDAEGMILGRMATEIATILMGKHRPEYTPHVDSGDHVIVTNAAGIKMTGKKFDHKTVQRFSGYAGGLRVETFGDVMEKHPERIIENAVRRMLPKGRLGRSMVSKLHVYADANHPHQAQQPAPLAIDA